MSELHIIIVNYNAGDWLKTAVGSALEHSTAKLSVIDNASSDQSVDTIRTAFKDEARLEIIVNTRNVGFAAANNQVLQRIQDDHELDYVVLMNPDCELRHDTMANIIEVLNGDEKIGIASCRILNEDGSVQKTCKRRFPTPKTAAVRMFGLSRFFPQYDFDYGQQTTPNNQNVEIVDAISGAFMVVRRSALQQVGLLDERYFMHCEDLDWCKRFQLNNWSVVYVDNAEVTHAKGVSSRARPIGVLWNLHTGMDRFFSKFYADTFWPLRILVKVGIYLSFVPRAVMSLVAK